mgnify:CR=1 FL=1
MPVVIAELIGRPGAETQLLTLAAAHGTAALTAALERAVTFSRWRADDVRSILAAGTGTPQPRTAGDALILDLPVAPTRQTAPPAAGGNRFRDLTPP